MKKKKGDLRATGQPAPALPPKNNHSPGRRTNVNFIFLWCKSRKCCECISSSSELRAGARCSQVS